MPATPLAQPVLFVSHGAPTLALDGGDWAAALAGWSRTLEGVRALLVMSAHWETPGPVRVMTSPQPGTLHDFSGFPERLDHLQYPAPGDPALADRVLDLLREGGVEAQGDAQRPLDHGAWVPLRAAFPEARIPVVQVSLPASRTPSQVFHLGRLLRPLRQEGVLMAGSGGVVHNLRLLDWSGRRGPEDRALGFEAWMAGRVARKDLPALFRPPGRPRPMPGRCPPPSTWTRSISPWGRPGTGNRAPCTRGGRWAACRCAPGSGRADPGKPEGGRAHQPLAGLAAGYENGGAGGPSVPQTLAGGATAS